MNKRILKACRAGNDFREEWYMAQRWIRMSGVTRETGLELQNELIQRKGGY